MLLITLIPTGSEGSIPISRWPWYRACCLEMSTGTPSNTTMPALMPLELGLISVGNWATNFP